MSNEHNSPPSIPVLDQMDLTNAYQEDLDALDNIDFMGGVDLSTLPPEMEEPPFEDVDQGYTPLATALLLNKIEQLNKDALAKDPSAKKIELSTPFPKNKQSDWIAEFNQMHSENPADIGKKILIKANGYFYKEDETIESALGYFGVKKDRLQYYAGKFEKCYFGNTLDRKKPKGANQEVGSKSFVLCLKDPNDKESIEILNDVLQNRKRLVDRKINTSQPVESARDALIVKFDSIVEEEAQRTGKKPFCGTDDVLFLQRTAVYNRLKDIPEIEGLFSVSDINSPANQEKYVGYSNTLDSYYEDSLKVCSVNTNDPVKMPQEKLEEIVSHALRNDNGNLFATPKEALKLRVPEEAPAASVVAVNPTKTNQPPKPNNPSDMLGFGDDQSGLKGEKPRFDDGEEINAIPQANSGSKSLSEVAANAIGGLSKEALKLLMAMVLALLKALATLAAWAVQTIQRIPQPKKWGDDLFQFKDYFKYKLDWNINKLGGVAAGSQLNANNNDKLAEALETQISESKLVDGKDYADKMKLDSFDGINPRVLVGEKTKDIMLSGESDLKLEAETHYKSLSDVEKMQLIADTAIPTLHSIDKSLDSKVAEHSLLSPEHGVLLAKNDRVVAKDGSEYGVLGAYSVGGALVYAVARDGADGNYVTSFEKAEDLTLTQHNGVLFDNEANLIAQTDAAIRAEFPQSLDVISAVELLDHDNPSTNALTPEKLAESVNIVAVDSLGVDLSVVSPEELLASSPNYKHDLSHQFLQLHGEDLAIDRGEDYVANNHPLFGSLLDINDKVAFSLPSSNIQMEGGVHSAYAHENELYYLIKSQGGSYSINAASIQLLEKNSGGISPDEIPQTSLAQRLENPRWSNRLKKVLPQSHREDFHPIQLATHADNSFPRVSVEHAPSTNALSLKSKLSTASLSSPIISDGGDISGANKHIIYKDAVHGVREFVSIGDVVDVGTGAKRTVCIELGRPMGVGKLQPIQLHKNKFHSFNMDENNVEVVPNSTFIDPKNIVSKATKTYCLAVKKQTENIASKELSVQKDRWIAANNGYISAAKEMALKTHKTVMALNDMLAKKAPALVVGAGAVLSSTAYSFDSVRDLINNPPSRQATPSHIIASNPTVLSAALNPVAFEATTLPSINDFIDSVKPVVVEPAVVEPAVVEPAVVEPAVVEPAVVEPVVVEPAVVEPVVVEPAVVEPAVVEPVATNTPPVFFALANTVKNSRLNEVLDDRIRLDGEISIIASEIKKIGDACEARTEIPSTNILKFGSLTKSQASQIASVLNEDGDITPITDGMIEQVSSFKDVLMDHIKTYIGAVNERISDPNSNAGDPELIKQMMFDDISTMLGGYRDVAESVLVVCDIAKDNYDDVATSQRLGKLNQSVDNAIHSLTKMVDAPLERNTPEKSKENNNNLGM